DTSKTSRRTLTERYRLNRQSLRQSSICRQLNSTNRNS
ncbi:hypothetical protein Trydic_g13477, partial [Trypoxylus dichotomus]